MAWTPPPSYTNGQIITQTDLHVGLRDNMKELWHELAYVEFTSVVNAAGGLETTAVDVVSSGAITYLALPTAVEFYCPNFAANTTAGLSLYDGSTDLGRMVYNSANTAYPVFVAKRLTPSAASHTYKVRIWSLGTASATGLAGGAGTSMPGYIRVWQRGG